MAKENAMEEERREQNFNEVIEPYVHSHEAFHEKSRLRCRAMSWRWLQEELSGWSQDKRARTGDEITKGSR